MSEFIEAMKVNDLGEGAMKKVNVGGREVLIARAGGKYYCADRRCPHLGGDLSQGRLNGTVVTCPVHGSQFDLASGAVVRWTDWSGLKRGLARALKAPRGVRTYAVRLDGDRIMVALE